MRGVRLDWFIPLVFPTVARILTDPKIPPNRPGFRKNRPPIFPERPFSLPFAVFWQDMPRRPAKYGQVPGQEKPEDDLKDGG